MCVTETQFSANSTDICKMPHFPIMYYHIMLPQCYTMLLSFLGLPIVFLQYTINPSTGCNIPVLFWWSSLHSVCLDIFIPHPCIPGFIPQKHHQNGVIRPNTSVVVQNCKEHLEEYRVHEEHGTVQVLPFIIYAIQYSNTYSFEVACLWSLLYVYVLYTPPVRTE